VVQGFVERPDDPDRQREGQELGGVVRPVGALERRVAEDVAGRLVDDQLDTAAAELVRHAGQERRRGPTVHQQGLGRVAHPGPLALGVDDDGQRLVQVGRRVDVHMAVAARGVDHRDLAVLEEVLLELLPAARDDEVDVVSLLEQFRELPAVGTQVGDGLPRQSRLDHRALDHLGEDAIGVHRRGAATEDDRVARLETQGRRVDGDVGARLVDHRDDAQRHPDAAHLHPVVEPPALDDLADGVGQRRDIVHRRLDVGEPVLVEQQSVDQCVREAVLAREAHIFLVLGQDLGRSAPQRVGHGSQRVVLARPRQPGEHPRRPPCLDARLFDLHRASSPTSTNESRCTTSSSRCGLTRRDSSVRRPRTLRRSRELIVLSPRATS